MLHGSAPDGSKGLVNVALPGEHAACNNHRPIKNADAFFFIALYYSPDGF